VTDLRPDRYIEASELGLELYRGVAELPIVSPHGHIDVQLFADPAARLDPPGRLFVTADHYVVRMLYSQGVPLEHAGLGETAVDDRAVWQLLADNVHLFALTPTGL
jgi:glucuronate isomerase